MTHTASSQSSSDRELMLELARNEIRLNRPLNKNEIEYITKKQHVKSLYGDRPSAWPDIPESLKKPFHEKFEAKLKGCKNVR